MILFYKDFHIQSNKIVFKKSRQCSKDFTFIPIQYENQDEDLARTLNDKYKKTVSSASDKIVSGIVSGDVKLDSQSKSASLVLYARYLKRIGAHLKNITSTVVNAYDRIGYEK